MHGPLLRIVAETGPSSGITEGHKSTAPGDTLAIIDFLGNISR